MANEIDLYCERTGPELWSEPLNAITNLAFVVAAIFAFRLARREQLSSAGPQILAFLIFSIGIGSGAFHIFAVRWALLADVIPITLYQLVFLGLYSARVMRTPIWGIAALLAAFLGSGVLADNIALLPNGSTGYVPAFVFLTGLGVWHVRHVGQERFGLLIAAGLFAISLTARTVDMSVCAVFPIGTHFLWHILNAGVLYLTFRGLVFGIRRHSFEEGNNGKN